MKREYYVFYCRARSEKKMMKELQSNGFEVFLPTIIEHRQWSDRVKKVESVLFPSYICGVKREYYVFYCRARSEKKMMKELQANGFEVFLPTIIERRQWSDRVKKVESVLFPSYIFVCCLAHQISTVAGYKHIVRPVKLDGNYAFLSDKDIEVINLFLKTGYTLLVHENNLRLGDKVKVVQGAFKDLEGVLIREKDSTRFAMELDVLDKTISVEIDAAALEKIPE